MAISPLTIDSFAALKAEQILAIPLTQPERIFTGDVPIMKGEYKSYAKLWHPDLNKDPKSSAVFAHITALHDKAASYLESGIWHTPGLVELSSVAGKKYRIRYLKQRDFELGEIYIGKSLIVFCVKPVFKDLFDNAVKTIGNFRYADDKMREQSREFLPSLKTSFSTADRHVLVLNKGADQVLLSDLLEHQGGKIDPRSVAWMMSRLHNITCYLSWAGTTHNAIALDTVLVSPAMHTATLSGGWWYAAEEGQKLRALPSHTLDIAPPDVLKTKKANVSVDLELIRAAGRELLGDPVGSMLKWNKDVPRPMADWLTFPSSGNAFGDYHTWSKNVLPKSFGPKRFFDMKVKPEDVYPQPA